MRSSSKATLTQVAVIPSNGSMICTALTYTPDYGPGSEFILGQSLQSLSMIGIPTSPTPSDTVQATPQRPKDTTFVICNCQLATSQQVQALMFHSTPPPPQPT